MQFNSRIDNILKTIVDKRCKTCWYGLGLIGNSAGKMFLDFWGITADYVTDEDSNKLEAFDIENISIIPKKELINLKEKMVIFLFVGIEIGKAVEKELSNNVNFIFIHWDEMISNDTILKKYFSINAFSYYRKVEKKNNITKNNIFKNKGKKIAVYTCITGNYDVIPRIDFIEKNVDYFLITDEIKGENVAELYGYKIIHINDILPKCNMTKKDQNRYCKMHGPDIFSEYDYSIYLDGNIVIKKDITSLISNISKYGLAFHKHPFSVDAYSEVLNLAIQGRIKYEEALDVVKELVIEGYLRNCGMLECGIIFCDNKNEKARDILNRWYETYMNMSVRRDQVAMSYILWNMGIDIDRVATLPGEDLRKNGYFMIEKKHKGYQK